MDRKKCKFITCDAAMMLDQTYPNLLPSLVQLTSLRQFTDATEKKEAEDWRPLGEATLGYVPCPSWLCPQSAYCVRRKGANLPYCEWKIPPIALQCVR